MNVLVAPLFDFESLGTGVYTFEPVTTFQVVEEEKPASFKISAKSFDIEVKSDVKKREIKANEKRARVTCSNTSQSSFISSRYAT